MAGVRVRVDRVQIASWAPRGRRPPELDGYKVVRDWFVRCQTTTATYARSREYQSDSDGKQIFWQYERQKSWLKPWKITIVADDECGLSYEDVAEILRYCRFYRFLLAEVAIDFDPKAGVDRDFVRRHFAFGKSHEKKEAKPKSELRKPKIR